MLRQLKPESPRGKAGADERPRERLERLGAGALTDAELVALIVGSGTRGASALDVAREALTRRGGLAGLVATSRQPPRGFGGARSARLVAGVEIAHRAAREALRRNGVLT
jgi:DNA repair protein RadC